FGIVAIALVVGVNTQPVHVTALVDLILADHRDAIFRLAGNDAVVATNAGIQINRHAPCVMRRPAIGWGLVVVRWIQGLVFPQLFFVEIRFFFIFLKRGSADDIAMLVAYIRRLIALCAV